MPRCSRTGERCWFFSHGELSQSLDEQRRRLKASADNATEDYLLNIDIEEWVAHLASEYAVDVPELYPDQMVLNDEGETQVDVSHEHFNRAISDPSTPSYVPGRRIRICIPFSGDARFFTLRGSSWDMNPPRAIVAPGELQLVFEFPTDVERRPDIKAESDAVIRKVERGLEVLRPDCEAFHRELETDARNLIQARRDRVLADHAHLDNLGIPIQKRDDAPTTYQAPAKRKRPVPKPSKGKPLKPAQPEPTLVRELYEHALKVIGSTARAMERTPSDYTSATEEKLRDLLLIVLNTHYEGQGQAEAFNKGGKTDILIRFEDRNIFIGECKLWRGEKSLGGALNQLSSYATWRDMKLSLVFFLRQKSVDPIIAKARAALEAQPTFGEWKDSDEGELRCTMGWPGDVDRRADLAVFFVHLPRLAKAQD